MSCSSAGVGAPVPKEAWSARAMRSARTVDTGHGNVTAVDSDADAGFEAHPVCESKSLSSSSSSSTMKRRGFSKHAARTGSGFGAPTKVVTTQVFDDGNNDNGDGGDDDDDDTKFVDTRITAMTESGDFTQGAKEYILNEIAQAASANGNRPFIDLLEQRENAALPFPLLPLRLSGLDLSFDVAFTLPLQSLGEVLASAVLGPDGVKRLYIPLENSHLAKEFPAEMVPRLITLEESYLSGFLSTPFVRLVSESFRDNPQVWQSRFRLLNRGRNNKENDTAGVPVGNGATLHPRVLFEWNEDHINSEHFQNWCHSDFDALMAQVSRATKGSQDPRYFYVPLPDGAITASDPLRHLAITQCGSLYQKLSAANGDMRDESALVTRMHGRALRVPRTELKQTLRDLRAEVNREGHVLDWTKLRLELAFPDAAAYERMLSSYYSKLAMTAANPAVSATFVFRLAGAMLQRISLSEYQDEFGASVSLAEDDLEEEEGDADATV